MKIRALALGASLLGLSTPAMANDGLYIGAGISHTSSDHSATQSVAPTTGGGWFTAPNRAAINAAPAGDLATDDFSAEGLGGFAFAGYQRHVSDGVTLGVEIDVSVFDVAESDTHSQSYPTPPGTFVVRQSIDQRWLSTIRARLGFDITSNAMFFVTAGAAFSDVEFTTTFSDTYPLPQQILAQSGSESEIVTGSAYSAGLDWKINDNASARFEYLRADLGDIQNSRALTFNTGASAQNEVLASSADLTNDTVRLGVSWSLN